MPQITLSPKATQDLEQVWHYIAQDSPKRADQFLKKIQKSAEDLASFPLSGKLKPELAPLLRSFPVGKYLIFYRSLKQEKGIEIARVLHGSRELKKFF